MSYRLLIALAACVTLSGSPGGPRVDPGLRLFRCAADDSLAEVFEDASLREVREIAIDGGPGTDESRARIVAIAK